MARKNKFTKKITPKPTLMQRLRSNFFTGIVIVAPVVITMYLIWTVVTFIDTRVVPLVPALYNPSTYLGQDIPGFGVVIFLISTAIIGSLTKGLFGRQVLRIWENLIGRTPVVRSVYSGLKQIVETVLSQSSTNFQNACLIEYPREGIWAIAFISTASKGEVLQKTGEEEMQSVFLPTTPNPTSGFLLFVPRKDVVILDMTVEDAAKLVISAGLVVPPTKEEIAAGAKPVPAKKT